jgi:hypothetical protein
LEFIRITRSSRGAFEKKCGLPNATLKNKVDLNADLTTEIIDKISICIGPELAAEGFYVVNISPFENQILVVVNSEERKKLAKSSVMIMNEEAQQERRASDVEDRIKEVEINLKKVQENQEWVLSLAAELLNRDVGREAGGNREKEQEILDELAKRIGPDLPEMLKTGIRADGHKKGMEIP